MGEDVLLCRQKLVAEFEDVVDDVVEREVDAATQDTIVLSHAVHRRVSNATGVWCHGDNSSFGECAAGEVYKNLQIDSLRRN